MLHVCVRFSGNGEIDLQTLVSVISSKTTNPGNLPPNDMNELFRMYDKDNSGRITVAEMRHLLTTVGEKLSEEEADTLFKMTGCLEQGRVNYQSTSSTPRQARDPMLLECWDSVTDIPTTLSQRLAFADRSMDYAVRRQTAVTLLTFK